MSTQPMQRESASWPAGARARAGLRDAAIRKDWTRRLGDIARVVETAEPAMLAVTLADTRGDFAEYVQGGKAELLGNPLCWDAEEREIAGWIAEAFGTLARAATRAAERTAALGATVESDAKLRGAIVAALISRGSAQKWHAIAGSQPATASLARIHGLFRLAERRSLARVPCEVAHEGVRHTMTIEALYLRVLLFGFFFTGHLSRQRVEILDSWLWPWVCDYRLTAQPEVGELGLWVDLQTEEGAHSAFIAPSGLDVRYLVISSLESHLDEVVGGFHAGTIFPGYGVSCDFRIEEHVGVVDYLQRLVQRLKRAGGAPRSARRTLSMPRIEGFVGIGEIVRKGMVAHDVESDRPKRWLRIRDVSDTGLRLVAQESDWQAIEVGDLLGFREPASGAFVVGEVVRKLPDTEPQCVQLGVSVISRNPRHLALHLHERTGRGANDALDVLYLPGDDNCGRGDMLLTSEHSLQGFGVRDLDAGGFRHAVQVNRVRRHGRGWAATGFEVLGATPTS